MSLFCGKKCECKNRCKSWFQHDVNLLDGCISACKSGDTDLPSPEAYIQNYAPWYAIQQQEKEAADLKLGPYMAVAGIMIVGLIVYYLRLK